MKYGRADALTHEYKRSGVTTLFAALNVSDGRGVGRNVQRHRRPAAVRSFGRWSNIDFYRLHDPVGFGQDFQDAPIVFDILKVEDAALAVLQPFLRGSVAADVEIP